MKQLLVIAALSVTTSTPALAQEWYGTIVYKHLTNLDKTENKVEGTWTYTDVIKDRTEIQVTTSWTNNETQTSDAQGSRTYNRHWTGNAMGQCWPSGKKAPFNQDRKEVRSARAADTRTTKRSSPNVNFNADGTYVLTYSPQGGAVHGTEHFSSFEIRTDGCTGKVERFPAEYDLPWTVSGVPLPLHGVGSADAATISGTEELQLNANTKAVVTWSLSRTVPKVVAQPGGPYEIERLQTVTLSGAGTGPIHHYGWEVRPTGEDCPENGPASLYHDGKTWSFTAVCDMEAKLTVRGEDGVEHSATTPIHVRARPNWETSFRSEQKGYVAPLGPAWMQFGTNACATEGPGSGHKIHRADRDPVTWNEVGYTIARINDMGGPYHLFWVVANEDLKVDRHELYNTELRVGSDLQRYNAANGNERDFATLIAQVKAHEKWHSDLMKEVMTSSAEWEPARKIERLCHINPQQLQRNADAKIREAESELFEATDEIRVKNRLRNVADFRKVGKILFPPTSGTTPIVYNLGVFAEIGDDAGAAPADR